MVDLSGILGALHQGVADNRSAFMGAGAALMSGPMSTAMPAMAQAMQRGALVDQRRRAMELEQIEAERKRQAQLQMAKALGLDPVFADSPSVLNAVAADRFKSKEAAAPTAFDRLKREMTPEQWKGYLDRQAGIEPPGEAKRPMTQDIIEYEYEKEQAKQLGQPVTPFPEWKANKAGQKPLTAEQGKAGAFTDRAENSETVLSELGSLGTDRKFRLQEQYSDQVESGRAGMIASGANALASGLGAKLGQAALTPEQQRLRRAENDFLTAILRKESGAVIGASEFPQERVKYLPQPGDSPEVLADKKEARRIAIEGLKRESGPAYKASSPAPRKKFDQYGNPL